MSTVFGQIDTKSHKSLRLRFLAAILVPATLLCLSLSFGMHNLYKQYLFTQKEILGAQAVKHLFEAVSNLQEIRGYTRILAWSEEKTRDERRHRAMVKLRNSLESEELKRVSRELDIEEETANILKKSQEIYSIKNTKLNEYKLFTKYTHEIEKTISLILTVIERSNLILDPQFDTYYLMDISAKKIPDLAESFAKIRGIGSGLITNNANTEISQELFNERVSILLDHLAKFERTKSSIHELMHVSEATFKKQLTELDKALRLFLNACGPVEMQACTYTAQEFFKKGSLALSSLSDTFQMSVLMLEERLNKRADEILIFILLTFIASIVALTSIFYFAFSFYLRQQQAHSELEHISITDPLTGIPNRRYLDTVFESEMHRARRDGKMMAFGILDIDFFKLYNDTYGHHEGDLALQKVAQALKESLQRAEDFYFRFGGEEFCFLCHTESLHETEDLGECIRASVEKLKIEHKNNKASPFVTVSIGITHLPEVSDQTLDYMIKHSDELLYKAKERGRNQCIVKSVS